MKEKRPNNKMKKGESEWGKKDWKDFYELG